MYDSGTLVSLITRVAALHGARLLSVHLNRWCTILPGVLSALWSLAQITYVMLIQHAINPSRSTDGSENWMYACLVPGGSV